MKRFLLFFVLSVCVFNVKAQPSVTDFHDQETLSYTGYYNCGFIWVKTGVLSLKTSVDMDKYKISATCSSAKAWDWFFKVRDTMQVSGSAHDVLPNKFERIVHEGSYLAHFNYKFDYDSSCVTSNGFKRELTFVDKKIKLDTPAIDVISFSFYLRSINFDKYKSGDKIPVRLLISNDIYNLYIRYKGIETIKIKSGERIECYKISPMLIKGNTFSGGESSTVWISKDFNRIPVMLTAEVVVGSIKAVISSYSNIRYKSKIFPTLSATMGR